MTDYLNIDTPIINGDAHGNYPWMRVRAGAIGSSFAQVNMAGRIYDKKWS